MEATCAAIDDSDRGENWGFTSSPAHPDISRPGLSTQPSTRDRPSTRQALLDMAGPEESDRVAWAHLEALAAEAKKIEIGA